MPPVAATSPSANAFSSEEPRRAASAKRSLARNGGGRQFLPLLLMAPSHNSDAGRETRTPPRSNPVSSSSLFPVSERVVPRSATCDVGCFSPNCHEAHRSRVTRYTHTERERENKHLLRGFYFRRMSAGSISSRQTNHFSTLGSSQSNKRQVDMVAKQ